MLENELRALQHLARSKDIPYSFDKIQWKVGNTYRIRIGHIYDLSKFWIINLEKELTLFQDFLNDFFTKNGAKYKMPKEVIEVNIYCIGFSDGGYYRGIIVNIPCIATARRTVLMFLFDFGFLVNITLDNLYFLPEKFYGTPRFAIRACLNRIQPRNGDAWTYNDVKRFNDLVSGKVLLCIVEYADLDYRTLYVNVGSVNEQSSQVNDIGEMFLSEKLARPITSRRSKREEPKAGFIPKTKYPWLYPSFDEIEQGTMPSSVYIMEMMKKCKSSQFLLRAYYDYVDPNDIEVVADST